MDIAEADRLSRDFAKHAKLNGEFQMRPRWNAPILWILSLLLFALMAAGVMVALL